MSKASRDIGFLAAVSARALIDFGEFAESSIHDGNKPYSNRAISSVASVVVVDKMSLSVMFYRSMMGSIE